MGEEEEMEMTALLKGFGWWLLEMAVIGGICWAVGRSRIRQRWFGDNWKALSAEIPWQVMVAIALVIGVVEYLVYTAHTPFVGVSIQEARALAFQLGLARFFEIAVFGLLGGFGFRKLGIPSVGQIAGAMLGASGFLGYGLASIMVIADRIS